jgi:hypothetical protein
MTRQRFFILVGGLIFTAVTAFLLRDVILRLIILPLSFLWWALRLLYRLIPQAILWGVLVAFTLLSAVQILIPEIRFRRRGKEEAMPMRGQVETLSISLRKTRSGNYYKWMVANRLGKLARELLDQREGRYAVRRFDKLTGRDWSPPEEVSTYLDIGLNGSFADYPPARVFNPQPTPLDVDPAQVVEYLESEMENNGNGHH